MICIDMLKQAVTGCLLFAAVSTSVVAAQQTDRQQPMTVEADTAELNERSGVSIYKGNVVVIQGSLNMKADRMTLKSKDRKLTRMTGTGKPAMYRQIDSSTGEPVYGEADKIVYLPEKNQLILTGNASLLKNDNTFKSERIVYNMTNDYVSAGSKEGGKRVKIVIQPVEDKKDAVP